MRRCFLLGMIPIFFFLLMATVFIRLRIIRATYELAHLQRENHRLEVQLEKLQIQLTSLRSPQRLEKLARGSRFDYVPSQLTSHHKLILGAK